MTSAPSEVWMVLDRIPMRLTLPMVELVCALGGLP
jgi:hypothetical protein